eukprot:Hpha_TRINITY_DN15338_c1_g3::TRINITY_DN15338_c1_g3_i2::g.89130::m.89130
MFVRLYSLIRLAGLVSQGYEARFDVFDQQQLRGRYRHLHVGWFVGLKTLFLRYALICWACLFALAILSSAVVVYFAERDVQPSVFVDIWDSLWFMFISYTTIGYGDMYPISALGRAATVVWGLIGLILVQVLTAICTLKLAPTPAEAEILSFLDRRRAKRDFMELAASLIQCIWQDTRARAADPHSTGRYHPSLRIQRLARDTRAARFAFRDQSSGEQGLGIVVDLLRDQGKKMREFILATRTVGHRVAYNSPSASPTKDLRVALLEEVREQRRLLETSLETSITDDRRGSILDDSKIATLLGDQRQILDALKELPMKMERKASGSSSSGRREHEVEEATATGAAIAEERQAWLETKVGAILCNQQTILESLDDLTRRMEGVEEGVEHVVHRDSAPPPPVLASPPTSSSPPAAPDSSVAGAPDSVTVSMLQQQNEMLASRFDVLTQSFLDYRRIAEERQAWLETKLGAVLCNQRDQAELLDALRSGDASGSSSGAGASTDEDA